MPRPNKRAARQKRNPVSNMLPAIKKNVRAKAEKIPIETTTTTTVRVRPRQATPKKIKGRGKQLEPATLRLDQLIKGRKGFKQRLKKKVTDIGQHFRLKRRGSAAGQRHDQPIYYEIPRVMPNRAFDIGWRPGHALVNADDEYVLADPNYDGVLDFGHGTPKTPADVVVQRRQRKKTPDCHPVYENVGSELFYDAVPQCAPPKLPASRNARRQQDVYYAVMK